MRRMHVGVAVVGLVLVLAGGQRVASAGEGQSTAGQVAWRIGQRLALIAVEACDERLTEEILDDGYGFDLGEEPHASASKYAEALGVPLPPLPALSQEEPTTNVPVIVRYLLEKEIPAWRKSLAARYGALVAATVSFSLLLHLYAWYV